MNVPYEFFGKKVTGQFTIPSGVVGTRASVLAWLADNVPELGILTTKSIGLYPIEGNREPIIASVGRDSRSLINAVGLKGPGAEAFAGELRTAGFPRVGKFLLANIVGRSVEEFLEAARILFPFVDGYEISVTCPHGGKYGQGQAADLGFVTAVFRAVKSLGKPVVVKVSPNVPLEGFIWAALVGGADGFTAINTVGPVRNMLLSHGKGGLSGPVIREEGVRCVERIRQMIPESMPIIACGGIMSAHDARRYRVAGAQWFGVGTALAGLSAPRVAEYFAALEKDLDDGSDRAVHLLTGIAASMKYVPFRVAERRDLPDGTFLLVCDRRFPRIISPGQFVYIQAETADGPSEKPFSVLWNDPLTFLVKKRGAFTGMLDGLGPGAKIQVRGPCGNEVRADGRILLVGGGTGIAGISMLVEHPDGAIAALGASTAGELCREYFARHCSPGDLHLFTVDGSPGTTRGLATDGLEAVIRRESPDACIACGPKGMIEAVIRIAREAGMPDERILSSIDYVTPCGVGVCGQCATSTGLRACVDGPFLPPSGHGY